MYTRRATLALVGSLAVAGCGQGGDEGETTDYEESDSLSLSSSAFEDGEAMPETYTADGADVSPPLSLSGVPDDAETLALVVDDSDAGEEPWVHWLLWNVPAETTEIPEDVPTAERVEMLDGAVQGTNDFGDVGYGGPAPPEGDDAHSYVFRLLAVESELDVDPGASRQALDQELVAESLGATTLTGTYER